MTPTPGGTALRVDEQMIHAARHGRPAAVRRHLQAGARIDARGRLGNTALDWAILKRNEDMVRLLLDHGATLNPAGQRSTPLMLAVLVQVPSLIHLLLERGADPDLENDRRQSAAAMCTGTAEPQLRAQLAAWRAMAALCALPGGAGPAAPSESR